MTQQDTQFGLFAGLGTAQGVGVTMPLVDLEATTNATVLANLTSINNLIPKIANVFIRETKIFQSPIDRFVTVFDEMFGSGIEQAAFMTGALDQKRDGTCVGKYTPSLASQIDLVNVAYNIVVDVKDREINKAVINEMQASAYVAEKLKTPLKVMSQVFYRSWIQLLSDVVDGSRTISSTTNTNGLSTTSAVSVTYNPSITGYAGKVDKMTAIMPDVSVGSEYNVNSPEDVIDILTKLKSIAADFKFESTSFNKLGVQTFTTGVPLLIMEVKVLDAMDDVMMDYNAAAAAGGQYVYQAMPARSFRDMVKEFSELVEIDSFAALPTNVSYAGYGLKAVLMDRDALVRINHWADVEGQRCSQDRLTGYSWAGESTLSIWRGVDSYAMVFPKAGVITFASGNFTVKNGATSITSGDDIAPGTTITIEAAAGYDLSTVKINGVSATIENDKVIFDMPQENVTLVITTAAE